MRIAKIIGNVTTNRQHPALEGATLKLALPMQLENGREELVETTELITTWDELGCGEGSIVAISEGPEAVRPFRPDVKPIDAYVSALLDNVDLDLKTIQLMTAQQTTR